MILIIAQEFSIKKYINAVDGLAFTKLIIRGIERNKGTEE
jgi:hypothetical protein